MKLQITDLLDELQEVKVDILPYTSASEDRIKELTMKKISHQPRQRRQSLGFVRKILIAAAIIVTMAVPVLAATGIVFSDWTAGYREDRGNQYDESPLFGSGSNIWEASNWLLLIQAEDITPTGLTLVCEELGGTEKSGTLEAVGSFWLESWDGTAYVPLEETVPSSASIPISAVQTTRWPIAWEPVYGALPSGHYRVGIPFTCTDSQGQQETQTFYAKFRIFSSEIKPYLDQYHAAIEDLYQQDSYHLLRTSYPMQDADYRYFHQELWKNGDNYLLQLRYYGPNGMLHNPVGYLYRDGVGYALEWAAEGMDAEILSWQTADFVDADYYDGWDTLYLVTEAILGEVYDNGNTIYFVEFHDGVRPGDLGVSAEEALEINPYINHDYTERACTFDNEGNLIRVENALRSSMDPDSANILVTHVLEVLDTPSDEIARIIERQDTSTVPAFSWTEDRSTYSGCAHTGGFVNQEAQDSPTASQIIDLARTELKPERDADFRDGAYNMVRVFRDESEEIWKVVFQDSQDDRVMQIIYLNSKGQTVMIAVP